MQQPRLYAIFATSQDGDKPVWGMHTNGRRAVTLGRKYRGLVLSMPLSAADPVAFDAPTFRALSDRCDGDFRPAKFRS